MKKALSLFLATALAVLAFAACGDGGNSGSTSTGGSSSGSASQSGSQPEVVEGYPTEIDMDEDPYTVAIQVVTLPGTQFEGKEEREAAINAITVPAINAKVEIQEVWISEVVNTTSMAVAGNEKIDLVHVATVNPLSSLVGSDILLDMNADNLLQNRGPALVELFGDLLEAGYANGQQLAVPANPYASSSKGFYYNKAMADEYDITVPETLDMDGLEKVLYAFHEANPGVMPYYQGSGELNYLFWLQGYDGFGSEASYGAILDSTGELTIENLYASDLFRDYCLRMYQWRVDGIHPGDPTDTNPAQAYFSAEQLFTTVSDINPKIMTDRSAEQSFELGWTQMVAPKMTNSSITEYMWGIASNSERPDKAMDFLNFLYSNGEVANILKYGLEGDNYDFAEGSSDIVVINNSYNPMFTVVGNPAQMHILSPGTEDYVQQWEAFEASATVSPVSFYMFDDSAYQTESAVIYSTILEYLPRLQCGTADSEEATLALLEEFITKLEASGINSVIEGNQQQLDAWLAAR